MRKGHTRGALVAVAIAAVFACSMFGSVTAANANGVTRAQALRSAREYLQSQAFSFKGLIQQLKFEGYSTSDARYGASHSGANWFRQAARMAKQYLRSQPFSRSGMIEQLQFEGFTYSQARYGAIAAGL